MTERGEGVLYFAYRDDKVCCVVLDEAGEYNGDGDTLADQILGFMESEFSFVTV